MKSGGLLVMVLRHGPDDGRGDHPTDVPEIETLARNNGMQVLYIGPAADFLERPGVSWTNVVLQLPDDGTGALPLLRHLILADAKSATYKLGLLRALCRIADGAAGLSETEDDDHIRLPLGLVALYWLRLYLPLVLGDLPQAPGNLRGGDGLGFAGPGWRALAAGAATQRDLQVGSVLGGEAAAAVHAALNEAANHICRMPANYLKFPDGGKILHSNRTRTARKAHLVLDGPTLNGFGGMTVPKHLWTVMRRFSVWVEPALVTEWMRLMQGYATKQSRQIEVGAMASAMTWSDPVRDVALARTRALALLDNQYPLYCVWSGKRLTQEKLDIDHCFPWSAWQCGDLWNLVPADRRVNQQAKRDRIPSAELLQSAFHLIGTWWSVAYLRPEDAVLPERFKIEAHSSLPGLDRENAADPLEVQKAVQLQRMRLRQDQGVPEWSGRL